MSIYIEVIYDITFQGTEVLELKEYLENFGIETEDDYKIYIWGEGTFKQAEYDSLELNINEVEIWKNDEKLNLTDDENIKNKLIEAVENSIDDTRFYYSNYDYGEIYFGEDNDELANFFEEYLINN